MPNGKAQDILDMIKSRSPKTQVERIVNDEPLPDPEPPEAPLGGSDWMRFRKTFVESIGGEPVNSEWGTTGNDILNHFRNSGELTEEEADIEYRIESNRWALRRHKQQWLPKEQSKLIDILRNLGDADDRVAVNKINRKNAKKLDPNTIVEIELKFGHFDIKVMDEEIIQNAYDFAPDPDDLKMQVTKLGGKVMDFKQPDLPHLQDYYMKVKIKVKDENNFIKSLPNTLWYKRDFDTDWQE